MGTNIYSFRIYNKKLLVSTYYFQGKPLYSFLLNIKMKEMVKQVKILS